MPLLIHAVVATLAADSGAVAGAPYSAHTRYAAESPADWKDPSPHRSGFVTARGVRLHYLDWGGQGEVVLLLPGLGASAHAYDDFAPKLTDRFRVLALTPRAHGESGARSPAYKVDDSAEDVLALMDQLSIARAHLVGQSIAGATITRLAARHANRVGRLVYLDATFDYGGPDEDRVDQAALPRPRPEGGFATAGEYRAWAERYFFGTWSVALESDMWASAAVEDSGEVRAQARMALLADATIHPKEYRSVRVRALAVWAEKTLDSHYFWVDRADTVAMSRARRDVETCRRPWEQKGVDRFRRETRNGRVVAFPAHHWMIVTSEDRVLREIRQFLLEK